ncbi:MAG TPA: hypothetical protein VMZ29_15525 [Candidatus Bathyarchaeia archaeon]|nr:hypothetical protein [Candidatus Bathyarchaeia archaeon]
MEARNEFQRLIQVFINQIDGIQLHKNKKDQQFVAKNMLSEVGSKSNKIKGKKSIQVSNIKQIILENIWTNTSFHPPPSFSKRKHSPNTDNYT